MQKDAVVVEKLSCLMKFRLISKRNQVLLIHHVKHFRHILIF